MVCGQIASPGPEGVWGQGVGRETPADLLLQLLLLLVSSEPGGQSSQLGRFRDKALVPRKYQDGLLCWNSADFGNERSRGKRDGPFGSGEDGDAAAAAREVPPGPGWSPLLL